MSALSDYLEAGILNNIFRAATIPTLPSSLYVALYTVAPSDSGGGTEASGTGYGRVAVAARAPRGVQEGDLGQVDIPPIKGGDVQSNVQWTDVQ